MVPSKFPKTKAFGFSILGMNLLGCATLQPASRTDISKSMQMSDFWGILDGFSCLDILDIFSRIQAQLVLIIFVDG
jgi:hypothetical protein